MCQNGWANVCIVRQVGNSAGCARTAAPVYMYYVHLDDKRASAIDIYINFGYTVDYAEFDVASPIALSAVAGYNWWQIRVALWPRQKSLNSQFRHTFFFSFCPKRETKMVQLKMNCVCARAMLSSGFQFQMCAQKIITEIFNRREMCLCTVTLLTEMLLWWMDDDGDDDLIFVEKFKREWVWVSKCISQPSEYICVVR